jgi:hypothetical protein
MYRTRITMSLLSLSLALFAGCAEDPATDELATDDEAEMAPLGETESAIAEEAETAETADESIADEPAGAPAVEGEPAPFAGIEGNYTGGDVSDLSAAQPLDAAALAKMDEAEASAAAACTNPSEPVKRILGLTQYAQTKGFYCGPASGYMIIRYLHGASFRSRKNNATLSQAHIASNAHMKTEANGSTDWSSKNFTKGLNAWRGENWYVQVPHPTAKLFKAALSHSIGSNGMPVAADAVELAGGVHYNGHPVNRTIGHWLVAYGYDSCGGKAYFADPATSVWSSVKPKFSYDSKLFANRFLQNNGIAY